MVGDQHLGSQFLGLFKTVTVKNLIRSIYLNFWFCVKENVLEGTKIEA